ncbi:MAG: DNA (cytosine-5-)-methyltransferase [archaeon]
MNIISLFTGVGGLDLGFTNVGFKLVYANDKDRDVWETFEKNHNLKIDTRSINDVKSDEMPDADGILGGPPCQSWSLAGTMRGVDDARGKVFYEYIRVIRDKQPKFFLAENVEGIMTKTHIDEFNKIIQLFEKIGYSVSYKLLNAKDYGVPQERKRVIIVGYHKSLGKKFEFPEPLNNKLSLKESIGDLPESTSAKEKNYPNDMLKFPNHEHMIGSFSTMYMSRNRKKDWSEPSFTIQAGGRHAPLHPKASKMIKIGPDDWKFDEKSSEEYRRLSVRECARVQTFPDDFIFIYDNVSKGYKMIGNAVPVKLAEVIAQKIKSDLDGVSKKEVISLSIKQHHDALKHPRLGNLLHQCGIVDEKVIQKYRKEFADLMISITNKLKVDYPQVERVGDLPSDYRVKNVHKQILLFLMRYLNKYATKEQHVEKLFQFLTAKINNYYVVKNEKTRVLIKHFVNIPTPSKVTIKYDGNIKLLLQLNNGWNISFRIHPDKKIFKDNGLPNNIDKIDAICENLEQVIKIDILEKKNQSLKSFVS